MRRAIAALSHVARPLEPSIIVAAMASGINIYSQLLISVIRIVDINNSNCLYQHKRNFRGMGPDPHFLEWEDGPLTL